MQDVFETAEKIFMKYFKSATGIDPLDQRINSIDITKITLAEQWDTACWKKTLKGLTLSSDERVVLGLLTLSKSPIIKKRQKKNCIIRKGAIKYKS